MRHPLKRPTGPPGEIVVVRDGRTIVRGPLQHDEPWREHALKVQWLAAQYAAQSEPPTPEEQRQLAKAHAALFGGEATDLVSPRLRVVLEMVDEVARELANATTYDGRRRVVTGMLGELGKRTGHPGFVSKVDDIQLAREVRDSFKPFKGKGSSPRDRGVAWLAATLAARSGYVVDIGETDLLAKVREVQKDARRKKLGGSTS